MQPTLLSRWSWRARQLSCGHDLPDPLHVTQGSRKATRTPRTFPADAGRVQRQVEFEHEPLQHSASIVQAAPLALQHAEFDPQTGASLQQSWSELHACPTREQQTFAWPVVVPHIRLPQQGSPAAQDVPAAAQHVPPAH